MVGELTASEYVVRLAFEAVTVIGAYDYPRLRLGSAV
jgi:hypothetical protein